MPSIRRYETAFLPFQLLNTALIPPSSCSFASSGKGFPRTFLTIFLNSSDRNLSSSALISVSDLYPFCFLNSSSFSSSCLRIPLPSPRSIPSAFSITTSAYIIIRRRYESHTKRGLLVFLRKPGIVAEQSPILSTVSIIPCIDLQAPERHETSNALEGSPYFMFMVSSVFFIAAHTSGISSGGRVQLFL